MNQFEAYELWLSLKAHFTSNYNYFTYKGRVSATVDAYEKRKDKLYFKRLSKHPDPGGLVVANFALNKDIWVGDLFTENGSEAYLKWKKYRHSTEYQFKSELEYILRNEDKLEDMIRVTDGKLPELARLYFAKKVSKETLVILNKVINFYPHWNKNLKDEPMWDHLETIFLKFSPFLEVETDKYSRIVQQFVNTTT